MTQFRLSWKFRRQIAQPETPRRVKMAEEIHRPPKKVTMCKSVKRMRWMIQTMAVLFNLWHTLRRYPYPTIIWIVLFMISGRMRVARRQSTTLYLTRFKEFTMMKDVYLKMWTELHFTTCTKVTTMNDFDLKYARTSQIDKYRSPPTDFSSKA